MTTIVSFATRECLVIGCDSLATSLRSMIDPLQLIEEFLEMDKSGNLTLKYSDKGKPILSKFDDIRRVLQRVPYNQLPTVTKIFSLSPAKAGILVAGASLIDNKSIQNLIDEFKDNAEYRKYFRGNYTIKGISERLNSHIEKYYLKAYSESIIKPEIEILISGYSKATKYREPEIYRLNFGKNNTIKAEYKRGEYGIVFGGQYDVIQRVVKGIDIENFIEVLHYTENKINKYYSLLKSYLAKNKIKVELPKPNDFETELNEIRLSFKGLSSDLSNFSDQAAIEMVFFLIEIMIKSQQFSDQLPTVGGDIHIAIITKSGGFKWISKEEYKFKDYGVPKHEKTLQ